MFDTHRDPGDECDAKAKRAACGDAQIALAGHPNLSDSINRAIGNSLIAGGATPSKLVGKGYKVTTQSRQYTLIRQLDKKNKPFWTIEGHPKYCPQATRCNIHGSTFGGSMLKVDFIGRGMHLE